MDDSFDAILIMMALTETISVVQKKAIKLAGFVRKLLVHMCKQ